MCEVSALRPASLNPSHHSAAASPVEKPSGQTPVLDLAEVVVARPAAEPNSVPKPAAPQSALARSQGARRVQSSVRGTLFTAKATALTGVALGLYCQMTEVAASCANQYDVFKNNATGTVYDIESCTWDVANRYMAAFAQKCAGVVPTDNFPIAWDPIRVWSDATLYRKSWDGNAADNTFESCIKLAGDAISAHDGKIIAIVAGSVGGVAALAGLATLAYCCARRCRRGGSSAAIQMT